MEKDSIDQEFMELLNVERKKSVSYEISLEVERKTLLDKYEAHYAAIIGYEGLGEDGLSLGTTWGDVDDEVAELDSEEDLELEAQYLGTMLEQHMEDYLSELVTEAPILLEGMMKVAGRGVYVGADDISERAGFDILEDGYILGEFVSYAVAPQPSSQLYAYLEGVHLNENIDPPQDTGYPAVWQVLKNAVEYTRDGQEVRMLSEVHVPLAESGLSFSKIETSVGSKAEALPESEDTPIDLIEHFKGEFIVEQLNCAEAVLNYGDYSSEELCALKQEYENEFGVYTCMIEREQLLAIAAQHAVDASGNSLSLDQAQLRYVTPLLMKHQNSWRGAHVFELERDGNVLMVYVFPEHIDAITRIESE